MLGISKDLARIPLLDNPSLMHYRDGISDFSYKTHVMRDHKVGEAMSRPQIQ